MPLTRDFKETVKAKAEEDTEFRRALFAEAIDLLISGDFETGKILLRDYVNATIGFSRLGEMTKKSPKSLMRMLSPKGNPKADNMFALIAGLQKHEGAKFSLKEDNGAS
ncbi:MAG: DNA-binding protein [Rhodomicrobium sp.]